MSLFPNDEIPMTMNEAEITKSLDQSEDEVNFEDEDDDDDDGDWKAEDVYDDAADEDDENGDEDD